jgi:TolA-binding protein
VAHRKAIVFLVCILAASGVKLARADDTPKAAETRKKLATVIDVDFNDTTLQDAIDDLKEKVPALGIRLDTAGGVSRNLKITFKGRKKTLAEVFDGMFKKNDYGYVVGSKEGSAYDGVITIKQGKERGYAVGEEPSKTRPKVAAEAPSAKTAKKVSPPAKTKGSDAGDLTPENPEQLAATKLRLAKEILKDGKKERAKERLQDIVAKFPDTKAAEEARKLLMDPGS